MLRPMANLFAVADPDSAFLDRIEKRLRDAAEFDQIWRPAPGWVVAQAPLPESGPDSEELRSRGFVFAEGRDRLERDRPAGWEDRLAELTDRAPERLSELPGDFSFLRFRSDGSMLAVRSCAGLVPFYVEHRPRRIVFGTLQSHFPRFLPRPYDADPLMTPIWEHALHFIDDRTFLEGVSALPPASYTLLALERPRRTGTYWDPRPPAGASIEPDPERPEVLRTLLVEALDRDLDPDGRNLAMLSGGVDSSSVVALAAGVVGRGLSTWSMIPAHEPGRSHELSFINPLVRELGVEPARITELTFSTRERWAREAPGLPFRVVNPGLCELPRICAEQEVRVLVGGEFADEVGGHWARIGDWCRHTSLRELITRDTPLPFGRRDYLVWTKRRLLDLLRRPPLHSRDSLPAWVLPEVEEEYRDWLRRERGALVRDKRPLKELAEHVAGGVWVAMNWEATSALGVRRSLPFFNREVLELAFSCHPHELLGPGPKVLLRRALRGDVPQRNLERKDKASRLEDRPGRCQTSTSVALDNGIPSTAHRLARPDWLPDSPPDALHVDILRLRSTLRVAKYLEDQAKEAGQRHP